MNKITNSRFITYPTIEEKTQNHTVLLIDHPSTEFGELIEFFQNCPVDFDVYLYQGNTGDLEWLSHLSSKLDQTLINDDSQVQISSAERYGATLTIKTPTDYFQNFTKMVDTKSI